MASEVVMSSFEAQVAGIEEPIEGRALVRYVPTDGSDPYWGAMLRTTDALHILYGSDPGWFGRLVNKADAEHHMLSIPISQIETIELPPETSGLFARLFAPKEARATIVVSGGEPVVLDMDSDAQQQLIKTGARIDRPDPN
ncbi:MAG: hypothetical protein ACLFNT_15045 [Spirochaetales bacterium]